MLDMERRAKELQREYLRGWRKKNKDKMQQYRKNYWLRKAQAAEDNQNGGERHETFSENR